MTRQYIGARYVPKFDGEWKENKVYEPLTIVEYNNGSYTSKIPVPAGTLPTNKEYWALTGSTNGFIQKLQGDVEDLKVELDTTNARLDTTNENVTNVEERTTALEREVTDKRYIFITDSYGDNSAGALNYDGDTWIEFCCNYLGISPTAPRVYKKASAGAGFSVASNSFLSALSSLENDVENPQTITDIVVCGGCNDSGHRILDNEFAEFKQYCDLHYPLATVHVGHIGWFNTADFDLWRGTLAVQAYASCGDFGFHYLTNVEYIMHKYNLFGNGHHPNITGSKKIGVGVAQALKYGSCDVTYNSNPTLSYFTTFDHSNAVLQPMMSLNNAGCNFSLDYINTSDGSSLSEIELYFANPVDFSFGKGAALAFATVSGDKLMIGQKNHRVSCPVNLVLISQSEGKAYNFSATAYYENSKIIITLDFPTEQDLSHVHSITHMRMSNICFNCPTVLG